jgi:hypothetical protein
MRCFVCAASAEVSVTTGDWQSVRCPEYGKYDISSSAIDTSAFQMLGREQRRDALNRAKQAARWGKRPKITTYAT